MISELEQDIYDLYNIDKKEDYINYRDNKFRFDLKRKEILKKYDTGTRCGKCNNILIPSIIEDYDYQCLFCDEDFYKFEKYVIDKE